MMPHLQYLKLQLQFKSKITEHLYTKRELVAVGNALAQLDPCVICIDEVENGESEQM
jgi:hypothetical protein